VIPQYVDAEVLRVDVQNTALDLLWIVRAAHILEGDSVYIRTNSDHMHIAYPRIMQNCSSKGGSSIGIAFI